MKMKELVRDKDCSGKSAAGVGGGKGKRGRTMTSTQ